MTTGASSTSLPAGPHALITGGGTGIGAAIAQGLAASGHRVTLMGRREGPLAEVAATLPGAQWVTGDVTDAESVATAFRHARAAHGPISVLVCNAGAVVSARFETQSFDVWRQIMAVNLDGLSHCASAALADLRAAAAGRLVVVASTAGLKGYAYTSAYCAAKHGAIGLVRALALELARTRVTVNAVCPGFTETEIVIEAVAKIQTRTGRSEAEAREELAAFNPQGRLVMPEEVADAVAWLCAPGSGSINGQAIAVAGGEVM
ncbi:SDR family NAD(P)-dependent oxidoreductase [Polymorphobacter sp.]|uniref:SDR family NAD(P)-dependent oxidoreductase n=1 Tax=Polymorphobacter sp. TaxID=1909290 RepID=UPI003F709C92